MLDWNAIWLEYVENSPVGCILGDLDCGEIERIVEAKVAEKFGWLSPTCPKCGPLGLYITPATTCPSCGSRLED